MSIINQKILIFGGSGSLGHALINRYLKTNIIINYSRDECKHWEMNLRFNSNNLRFIIGDIRNAERVENCIVRENPDIIIIASALKHIEKAEYAVEECMATNYTGVVNVLNAVEKNVNSVNSLNLSCVIFVSSDKACSPINVYGMSKALGEKIMIEKSHYVKSIRFISVRYGNVLNSRGSIIPILHTMGLSPEHSEFILTHPDSTRFVMTLEQSVDLIEHAILHGISGDIIIPNLISMKISDLIELFSEKYDKPIKVGNLRAGEKLLESLINESQSMSMVKNNEYYYIKPYYANICIINQSHDYNSKINPLNKDELRLFLTNNNLL